ncbi:MAG TPA: hypothetical protein VLI90_03030 [Tepidisphaeraceae bacterium]|nr:hypothetical protein [Tepidisphaeraceae bacterium]
MSLPAIEGVVENGAIRLQKGVQLPERTRVFIIVAEPDARPSARIWTPRLAIPGQAAEFRKQVLKAPTDAKM